MRSNDLKFYYYRELNKREPEKSPLIETCKIVQDRYKNI